MWEAQSCKIIYESYLEGGKKKKSDVIKGKKKKAMLGNGFVWVFQKKEQRQKPSL